MKTIITLYFFLLFLSPVVAQQAINSVDSLETVKTATDSTALKKRAKPVFWQKMQNWENPSVERITWDQVNHLIYDDTGEFLSQLPYLRMWRDGDVGLFSGISINSAPSRLTQISIDGMPIPAGIWGQTDLTYIPETTLDNIELNPFAARLSVHTQQRETSKPFTLFDYVMGPYGSDTVRLRFQRQITAKWHINWGATFANSDGQWYTPYYGPFDANRVHGIIDYRLRPTLKIRYRFLQSDDEAIQSYPYFLDEYPQILNSKRDQRRFLNSLEIARLVQNADSTQKMKVFDKWKFRLYHWKLQEQYSSAFVSGRYTKPQPKYSGMSGFYLQNFDEIGLKYSYRLENRQLENAAFPGIKNWQEFDSQVKATHRFRRRLGGQHEFGIAYHSDFNTQFRWQSTLKYQLSQTSTLSLDLSSLPYFPQPGEYAHEIETVLKPNAGLKAMRYSQIGVRFDYAKDDLHFKLTAGQAVLSQAIELTLQDSLFQFMNRDETYAFPTFSMDTAVPLVLNFRLRFIGSARFAPLEESSLFAEMPSMNASAELSYARKFFEGDLLAHALLRARYWHDRYHFYNFQQGEFLGIWQGGKGSMLDAEVRAFFRDAMIFMKFENITGIEDYWRPYVLMRSMTMKWGVSWALWD
ncbi:Plug domain-containing protein [candidate division KSB1 bacterium]|nr:Plug domain-containing protein [candidate division KSB1 bacterium]